MGGAYPPMLEPSSRLCLAPQRGGVPMGTKIMGTSWGLAPKAPWAPLGGIHSREARWGVRYPPYYFPSVCPPPDGPHIGVLVGTSQESWENSILDIRVLLWLLLT